MKIGESITLVVESFAPARRSIDLAIPTMTTVKMPPADAAEEPSRSVPLEGRQRRQPRPSTPADVVAEEQPPRRQSAEAAQRRRPPAAAPDAKPKTRAEEGRSARRRPRRTHRESSATPVAEPAAVAAPAKKRAPRKRGARPPAEARQPSDRQADSTADQVGETSSPSRRDVVPRPASSLRSQLCGSPPGTSTR